MLAAIVIGFAATALYLVMIIGAHGLTGSDHMNSEEGPRMNGLPFLQHLIIVPVLLPMLVGALLIPVNQNRHQLRLACSLASTMLLWLLSVALLRLATGLSTDGSIPGLQLGGALGITCW